MIPLPVTGHGAHLTCLSTPPCAILQTCFNPQGTRILTASSDKMARLWDADSGDCLQILEGHTDEIFSCAFNYEGDTIITGKPFALCGNL